jgi:lipopolysaccharide/colanic/teichoic acid biosynthesis glycosyltransferase
MIQRTLALVLAVLVAPLVAVLALLVRLDGGPALFRQTRLGAGRAPFTIHKLRTMRDGAVTPVGRVLRRTGLDELPQLVDIARGRMRFIGPRPLTEADVARLEWDGAERDERWQVPPGLTGYAQFAPVCDRAVSWSLDEFYVRHRSAALDLKITAASCAALVLGKQRAKGWFWG